MEVNDRVARCRLVASLIVTDDIVEEEELAYLQAFMKRIGLTEEETALAMVVMDEDKAHAALGSLGADERADFIRELAAAAWIDGNLDPDEEAFVRRAAAAIGVDGAAVDAALRR